VPWALQPRMLVQDTTYEVKLHFTQPATRAWSEVLVTVGGADVFPKTRQMFAPGPGHSPAYTVKSFEARSSPNGLQVSVSSLNGFPPISGVEVWHLHTKDAFAGLHLLDSADNHLVVARASKHFRQTPTGEVLYPGPDAFSSAGLTMSPAGAQVTPSEPSLGDLVAGGLFSTQCTAPAGTPITATFSVQQSQEYRVTIFWAETSCAPPSAVWERAPCMRNSAPGSPALSAQPHCSCRAACALQSAFATAAAMHVRACTCSRGTPLMKRCGVLLGGGGSGLAPDGCVHRQLSPRAGRGRTPAGWPQRRSCPHGQRHGQHHTHERHRCIAGAAAVPPPRLLCMHAAHAGGEQRRVHRWGSRW
jgi:hypothetical protein